MARRTQRTPPTPAQRRRMIAIGAILVFAACFTVMFEVVVNERQSLLFVTVAALVLFLVFILPIVTSLRHAPRATPPPQPYVGVNTSNSDKQR